MVLQSYGWRMRSLSPAAGLANFEKWLQFQLPFGGWSFFLFFTFFSLSPRLHPWMAPNGVFSQEEKNALLFSLSFLRLLRRFSKFSPPPSSSVPNQTEKGGFLYWCLSPPSGLVPIPLPPPFPLRREWNPPSQPGEGDLRLSQNGIFIGAVFR